MSPVCGIFISGIHNVQYTGIYPQKGKLKIKLSPQNKTQIVRRRKYYDKIIDSVKKSVLL